MNKIFNRKTRSGFGTIGIIITVIIVVTCIAGLKRLIVVILTSSQQIHEINRAYDLGANSYLVKPLPLMHCWKW
jgi:DNA-binding NarL/FixJ family response regulator